MKKDQVRIHILPGGVMPERKSKEAIGYDVCIRSIVSPTLMCTQNGKLRKTIFDFEKRPKNPHDAKNVVRLPKGSGEKIGKLGWRLGPGRSVLVGIGFITSMRFPMFYWVAPRSGLASRWGITVTNAPGTVDPDYRGEAGVLVYNRTKKSFIIQRGMRIAQIIFQRAIIPEFLSAATQEELLDTERGVGGFGSTGLYRAE